MTDANSGLTPSGGEYSAMIVGRPRPSASFVTRATIAAMSPSTLSTTLPTCRNPIGVAKYDESRSVNVCGAKPIANVTFSYGKMSFSSKV